ncbi:hypothetical protein KSP39_PZI021976 [Platanthera zijinensis]|uniref:Uncharacterized protein n=1 Tax=Platanthera zijinensis TaxID=2320716 RepID=A0AAP0AYU1_9ASPA
MTFVIDSKTGLSQSRTIPLRQHIVHIYNYETKVNSAENKQVSAPKLIPLKLKTMLTDTVEKPQILAPRQITLRIKFLLNITVEKIQNVIVEPVQFGGSQN